ncbi:MAG: hypothetical protein ACYC1C_02180 [Chloroflexota bacterium]
MMIATANKVEPNTVVALTPETDATVQQPTVPAIAHNEHILDLFTDALRKHGVVGQEKVGQLLYLAFTSRLLDYPVSVVLKGPSSVGKSYVVRKVSDFFPPSAFYEATSMSPKALHYIDESFEHRMLVFAEKEGISSEVEYLLRTLVSEGHLRHITVSTEKGLRPLVLDKEGPTGLITTTTRPHLHPENETRMLSLEVKNSPEVKTQICLASLNPAPMANVGLDEWHAYQEYLAEAEHRVAIPYDYELITLMAPVIANGPDRLSRDSKLIGRLIASNAILHQQNRRRDGEGQIIATLEDYRVVRELIADAIAVGVSASVQPEIRETVEAVKRLRKSPLSRVTVTAIGNELGVDKGTASRRVTAAIEDGYLVNEGWGKGKPSNIMLGEPLPETDEDVLPSVEVLEAYITMRHTAEVEDTEDEEGDEELSLSNTEDGSPSTGNTTSEATPDKQDVTSKDVPEQADGAEKLNAPDKSGSQQNNGNHRNNNGQNRSGNRGVRNNNRRHNGREKKQPKPKS